MKQRTRFSGLVAFLCLMATTALAQSYTIRFVKGTDRIDRQDSRTVGNLGELVSRLSDCKHQLEKGRYVVGLTAFQNVVDRYDPAAKSLSLAQAAALQEYLTDVCCLNDSAPFDLSVDARTDLDNPGDRGVEETTDQDRPAIGCTDTFAGGAGAVPKERNTGFDFGAERGANGGTGRKAGSIFGLPYKREPFPAG